MLAGWRLFREVTSYLRYNEWLYSLMQVLLLFGYPGRPTFQAFSHTEDE